MDPAITIRRIGPSDGAALRDLRLRSLTDAPDAFGQTEAEARQRPAADWDAQARAASSGDRRAWFLAEHATDGTIGLVSARRRPPEETLIFSMWVDPGARRGGVGRALLEAVAHWTRGWGGRRMVLWVFAANEGALRFYERLGFRVERDGADAASGRDYGALAMSVELDDALATGSGPSAAKAPEGG